MKRKTFLIILAVLTLGILFALTTNVKAADPTYNPDTGYILNGSQKCFFANGTSISIKERTDGQSGATIVWENGTKSVDVPNDINVFGGSHADSTVYENTKITMNGGTVKNVFGGGLHESHVTTSEVIINAGTVTGSVVGGGANVLANSDNCSTASSASSSPTRVTNANVSINNGTIYTVYGGGEGISNTTNATVNINGGTIQYVTGSGSNGYTGNAKVEVTSGNISILQSVNRGELVSANVKVLGGTIDKLYVGSEDDPSVTGTIDQISLDIAGGSVVNNLYIGNSGGQTITANGNNAPKVDVDIYLGATVHIANESEFANIPVTEYILVTINGTRYELERQKTLADLPELPNIKNVQGKEFVNFVRKDTKEVFAETTKIDSDIELEAIYKDKVIVQEKPKDETPKTGVNYSFDIFASFIIVSSIIGIAILTKIKE